MPNPDSGEDIELFRAHYLYQRQSRQCRHTIWQCFEPPAFCCRPIPERGRLRRMTMRSAFLALALLACCGAAWADQSPAPSIAPFIPRTKSVRPVVAAGLHGRSCQRADQDCRRDSRRKSKPGDLPVICCGGCSPAIRRTWRYYPARKRVRIEPSSDSEFGSGSLRDRRALSSIKHSWLRWWKGASGNPKQLKSGQAKPISKG